MSKQTTRVGIEDSLDAPINPATEDKQDDIVTAVEIPNDMVGGGKVEVGTTAVPVTFTGTTKAIIITADQNNTGTLYVGKSNVTNAGANAFTFLETGDSVEIDYEDGTNAVYVVSDTASQNFWKGALE